MKFILLLGAAAILFWLFRGSFAHRSSMSRTEAAKLLGIGEDSDVDMIIAAHKRLIAKVHPDAGGSAELAAQINRARDTLLKTLRS